MTTVTKLEKYGYHACHICLQLIDPNEPSLVCALGQIWCHLECITRETGVYCPACNDIHNKWSSVKHDKTSVIHSMIEWYKKNHDFDLYKRRGPSWPGPFYTIGRTRAGKYYRRLYRWIETSYPNFPNIHNSLVPRRYPNGRHGSKYWPVSQE